MVLVNFHVAGEVRMKVGFVRRVESQDKVALQISVIIEVGSGGNHQVKFHASHVGEIGLVCNQETEAVIFFDAVVGKNRVIFSS